MKILSLLVALFFCTTAFSQDADTDGDGVLDKDDLCPTVVGTLKNKGCPEGNGTKKEVKKEAEAYDSLAFAKEIEALLDAEEAKNTAVTKKNITAILEDAKNDFIKYKGIKLSSEIVSGTFYEDYYKYNVTIGGLKESITHSGIYATGKKRKYFKSDFVDKNNIPCANCSKTKNATEEIILQMKNNNNCSVDTKKDAMRTTTRLLNNRGETIMEVAIDSNNLLRFIIIYSAGTKLAALN